MNLLHRPIIDDPEAADSALGGSDLLPTIAMRLPDRALVP
jgi:hypothetical protein